MNATTRGNDLYTYHTFTNVELSGVLDRYKDYHLFIRYGNKVYMDFKGCGDIVMTFAELQKNKYWRHYYEMSLMLTDNKRLVIQDLQYNSNFYDPYIYEEKRVWSINTAYIEGDEAANVVENEYNCYYRINPYDLQNKRYATQKKKDAFTRIYMSKHQVRTGIFNKKSIHDYNIVFKYCVSLMEKELDELSAFFEDKKNVLNLVALNDKQGMNNDILMLIYNNLVSSASVRNKYEHLVSELGNCGQLESVARILEV